MSGWRRLRDLLRTFSGKRTKGTALAHTARPRAPRKEVERLLQRLRQSDPLVQARTAQELGWLGDGAAAEPLLGLLSEPAPVGPTAATALLQIGPPAFPPLLAALSGRNPLVSLAAADVLARAGGPAVPGLVRLLTDPHRSDRMTIAEVLGRIGPPAQEAVPALLHATLDQRESVRQAAAAALEKIDPDWPQNNQAEEAIPALVRNLTPLAHQPPALAHIAAAALARIGAPAVPALLTALEDDEHELRQVAAARILSQLRPVLPPVISALTDAVTNKAGPIRAAAAEALGEIGPEATMAVPALCQALTHWSEDVRQSAARSLGKIAAAADGAIVPLLGALADVTESVRRAAAESLARFAATALPGLIGCLKHRDGDVRRASAKLLGKMGPPARPAVTLLVETLVDDHEPARLAASEALRQLDPDWPKLAEARAALPVILQALAYRADAVPRILPATGALGFAAIRRLAIPARDDWHVRLAAAQTLGRLGVADPDVAACLRAAREDEHPSVSQAALDALQQMEIN